MSDFRRHANDRFRPLADMERLLAERFLAPRVPRGQLSVEAYVDRSGWKVSTPADAVSAARAALKAVNSPHADVSLQADLLEYVDDGVWLVVPGQEAPDATDVSAMVSVTTGVVELGSYQRATINENL